MVTAAAADFAELDGVEVVCLWDKRLPPVNIANVEFVPVASPAEESKWFDLNARNSDATLLIAPELGGELWTRTCRVEQEGGRLISPDSKFVELASSKYQCVRHLARAGIQVPATTLYGKARQPIQFAPPWIVKPDDGAGSIGVVRLEHPPDQSMLRETRTCCVQEYCEGQPASVSVLCANHQSVCLPPCWQELEEPHFRYNGGSVIEDANLAARATKLATAVAGALPNTHGLIGVDLILGNQTDGSGDYAIEVNPRLTTSYVGLRCLSDQNLARAMLGASNGELIALSFGSDRLEFSASGEIRRSAH